MKGLKLQDTGEASKVLREHWALKYMKFVNCLIGCDFVGHFTFLVDPDPDSQSGPKDAIESGSDPNQKQWF
jgi:hypothetical protein